MDIEGISLRIIWFIYGKGREGENGLDCPTSGMQAHWLFVICEGFHTHGVAGVNLGRTSSYEKRKRSSTIAGYELDLPFSTVNSWRILRYTS